MMIIKVIKTLKVAYNRTVSSIAFYPALIAIGFLILSWAMLELDFSELGKYIKAHYSWVRLKDASTARTIVSTISGGIISLMVFSFSMVMILLNQAASQMSNRMLESMIGNKFQQYVLGLYIGTIVYSLFLLSTIRDIDSGIYVPALSIYLLLLVTVTDIFVFIYFLHYVTQSVKFETIIERVHEQSLRSLKNKLVADKPEYITQPIPGFNPLFIRADSSGYFQGFEKKVLLKLAFKNDLLIKFLHPEGTYLLKNQIIGEVYSGKNISEDDIDTILLAMNFYNGQPVDHNFYYGFHQLTEVALKALSPGINDPETAVLSLNALTDLFYHRLNYHPDPLITDDKNQVRIMMCFRSFKDLFADCIYPIWDYGSEDRYIQNTLQRRIMQLQTANSDEDTDQLLSAFLNKVNKKIAES
ncbi:MAG: DUF2254 domain-containing protein [Sphingobacteriaceae bacterium]